MAMIFSLNRSSITFSTSADTLLKMLLPSRQAMQTAHGAPGASSSSFFAAASRAPPSFNVASDHWQVFHVGDFLAGIVKVGGDFLHHVFDCVSGNVAWSFIGCQGWCLGGLWADFLKPSVDALDN